MRWTALVNGSLASRRDVWTLNGFGIADIQLTSRTTTQSHAALQDFHFDEMDCAVEQLPGFKKRRLDSSLVRHCRYPAYLDATLKRVGIQTIRLADRLTPSRRKRFPNQD